MIFLQLSLSIVTNFSVTILKINDYQGKQMKKSLLLFLTIGIISLPTAFCLPKYGDAVIKKGSLTIVRNGQSQLYEISDSTVEVQENDVLRAGSRSQIVLNTSEQTTITIGSNAVFQVKSWEHRQKKGKLRMLFGKMLFKTKKLKGRRRFRLKTATAVMGVKGTEGNSEVGSTGNTILVCNDGVCTMQGNQGSEIEVPQNKASMSTGGKTSDTFDAETETDTEKGSANDPGSASLKNEQDALDAGVVDESDLEKSKETQADIGEQVGAPDDAVPEDQKEDDVTAPTDETDWVEYVKDIIDQTTETATEHSTYKTGKISIDFEK